MARRSALISSTLLNSSSFRRELETFLRLSADQLNKMAVIANGADGFSPSRQAISFSEQASLSLEEARQSLGIAEYLYERCRDHEISPDDAVEELKGISVRLKIGAEIAGKEAALRDFFSAKDAYESERYANLLASSVAGHFQRLDGVWDIRPVFHRDTGKLVAKVPVLLINLRWHDQGGESHDAVCQLDDEDWANFKEQVDKLQRQRGTLQELLEE